MPRRCKHCEVIITGCTPYCRTHKWARRRGLQRVTAENLLVDTAGGSWWAWDQLGNVLANEDTQDSVWIALGSCNTEVGA